MKSATLTPEQKLSAKVRSLTTEMLCSVYESMNGNREDEAIVVRGFVIDELECRDQFAFDAWMDCDEVELIEKPSTFFL
jgi:hypothetical protein